MTEINGSSTLNMPLNNKEHSLIVIFFRNDRNASVVLRVYWRMENLRRGPMSKFEETSSVDVAPRKRCCTTKTAIVQEVTFAAVEATACSSNASISDY